MSKPLNKDEESPGRLDHLHAGVGSRIETGRELGGKKGDRTVDGQTEGQHAL